VPADTSQASVQQAYLTALTNQINPIATALASANASTIINFHQYRINSPGSDTVIAFTIGGTAISVAQNINSSNQGVAQINEQSALQLKYQEIVNVAQNAAAGG
jgi:sensor c-di-GMP phosphodiesterase-like protein